MLLFNKFLFSGIVFLSFFSCTEQGNSSAENKTPVLGDTTPVSQPKPPAQIKDTLYIRQEAAVFYFPDSLQLQMIKAKTNPGAFESNMHEFFYQMRNARLAIKKSWPHLKILEAKNYRYLVFIKEDNTHNLVDLDTRYEVYGLYVFNRIKSPVVIDMYNVETGISFYLK